MLRKLLIVIAMMAVLATVAFGSWALTSPKKIATLKATTTQPSILLPTVNVPRHTTTTKATTTTTLTVPTTAPSPNLSPGTASTPVPQPSVPTTVRLEPHPAPTPTTVPSLCIIINPLPIVCVRL